MARVIRTLDEQTGEGVASIAARGLREPGSLTASEIRKVCASALSQREAKEILEEMKREKERGRRGP